MLRARLFLFARLFRNQWSVYSLKLVSLAIAFACAMLVIAFALGEFTVNNDLIVSDNIFRVLQRNETIDYNRNRLSDRIPTEIYRALNLLGRDTVVVSRVKVLEQITAITAEKSLSGVPFHAVEPSISDLFNFDFIHGSLLNNGSSTPMILLSATKAQALFGTSASVGRSVLVATAADTVRCNVSAVFRDWENTHEDFQVFLVIGNEDLSRLGYSADDYALYGRLDKSVSMETVESAISQLVSETEVSYTLQSIDEIYFGPRVSGESARHGDHYSIWILICITALIVFLAITNFANLTTLTLPPRSTELAIGKVAGAESLKLCVNLMQESLVMCIIAMALGIGLLWLTASILKNAFSVEVVEWMTGLGWQGLLIIILMVLIAAFAPLYPVVVFSTASPRRLLSTEAISFVKLKRFITTVQLGTSISLIVAGLVIARQIDRSLIKEPGRNHDQVVYLKYPKELTKLYELKLGWKRNNPNIVEVTAASQLPNNLQSKDASGGFYKIRVDHDFFSFFGIQLRNGRLFKANDQDSILVNESARGIIEDPRPIGTVQDFGSKFNQPDKPLQIMQSADYRDYSFLFIRILEVNIRDTEAYLYRFFREVTHDPVNISYFDNRFEKMLRYEDILNGLSHLLTIVGIIMACCAIHALSLSRVNDNLKQIAIRRTFGASRQQIVFLLSREFMQELLAACFFFGPITFLLLRSWLKNFVYAAHMHWVDPLLAFAACGIIIMFTNTSLIINMGRGATSNALRH
jgi:ABC-type antimicrobial peptide transport system permease subunit